MSWNEQEKVSPGWIGSIFRLIADEINRRIPPIPEPQRICLTCANMTKIHGIYELKCKTNVYAVSGELVSCDDERAGTGQILWPTISATNPTRCLLAGLKWEPRVLSEDKRCP